MDLLPPVRNTIKMNIPFVDLKKQYKTIAEDIEPAVLEVLRSCGYIKGKKTADFEKAFAALHNAEYCIAVNNGTAALHLALWALDIEPGDEVIVPVNTYIATAEAVSLAGATPVFIDHNEFFNLDTTQLESKLSGKTKAVIAVHLYGQPADLDPINKFCSDNNLLFVEDCAQSHLAEYKGRPTGTFGEVGCFSFYPGKNLGSCGEGGAVTTNDKDLYERMNKIHQHGVSDNKYHHHEPGHNYRMTEVQGAALGVKVKHIAEWTEMRRRNADLYRANLADVEQIKCPVEMNGVKHVYHLFVILAEKRDELSAYLNEQGISTGLHYPTPVHLQPAYASRGYKKGDFPIAEDTCEKILSLPMFPELTEEEIKYICEAIKKFL